MDTQQYLPFMIAVSTLLIIFDVYFLVAWFKYVRKKYWHKLFVVAPVILSSGLFISLIYLINLRYNGEIPGETDKILYLISYIWYLPKLAIVPIMIVKDIFLIVKRFSAKIVKNRGNKIDLISRFAEIKSINRRRFISNAGWIAAALPFGIIADGLLRTTYNYDINHVDVPMKKLPKALNGFKIVQISDIHAGSYFSSNQIREACEIINNMNPDLIVITGDFVNHHWRELPIIHSEIIKLKSKYGVYACLGNHDHYMKDEDKPILRRKIEAMNVKLIVNDNTTLNVNGETLQLAANDSSSWRHHFADFEKTFKGLDPAKPTILLCHDPSNWDKYIRQLNKADLTLSGHTHGGQVGVNLFDKEYSMVNHIYDQYAGLYQKGDDYIYVNKGLGVVGPPIRIGINPEITCLTLKSSI